MRDILDSQVNLKEITSMETMLPMVEKVPITTKGLVLFYLKHKREPACVGLFSCKDPITGRAYASCCSVYEADGFSWSTVSVYMFEKYDIRLSKEFLSFIEDRYIK